MQKFYWNHGEAKSNFRDKYPAYNDREKSKGFSGNYDCFQNGSQKFSSDFKKGVTNIQVNSVYSHNSNGNIDYDPRLSNETHKVLLRVNSDCDEYHKSDIGPHYFEKESRIIIPEKHNQRNYINKTWNTNSMSQAERQMLGLKINNTGKKRNSVRNLNYTVPNYENVFSNNPKEDSDILVSNQNGIEQNAYRPEISNHIPHKRKHGKKVKQIYRSKSCDRHDVKDDKSDLDNLSYKDDPPMPPSTPTPSIFQSIASQTIPCIKEMKSQCVATNGRISPAESVAYVGSEQEVSRPAQSLAHRMKGKIDSANKKMNMIRSRSAERLRSITGYRVRSEVIHVSSNERKARSRSRNRDNEEDYSGPFIGQARATIDYIPSPYDTNALKFLKGDMIDIISMNASGLWKGKCQGRVGNFKFVNVEIICKTHERKRSRSRSLRRIQKKPQTILEVLKLLKMEEHAAVMILNGYENLTLLKDLDDDELDYLGINDAKQREKLTSMAEYLYPSKQEDANSSDSLSIASDAATVTSLKDSLSISSKESEMSCSFSEESIPTNDEGDKVNQRRKISVVRVHGLNRSNT